MPDVDPGDRGDRTPVISVVMPAYNAAATIADQLEALCRNVLDAPWELIVADNGSTDETAQLALSYADRLPLRIVDASARRGPGAARNIGVAAARAPFIAFCDADDLVADDWLPLTRAALNVDEFVAIGTLTVPTPYTSRHYTEAVAATVAGPVRELPGLIHCATSQMAVRTNVFHEVGGFDELFLADEDTDFCCRVQLAGHPLVPHPEILVTIRQRSRFRDAVRQRFQWGRHRGAFRHKYQAVSRVLAEAAPVVSSAAGSGHQAQEPANRDRESTQAETSPEDTNSRTEPRRLLNAPVARIGRLKQRLRQGQRVSTVVRGSVVHTVRRTTDGVRTVMQIKIPWALMEGAYKAGALLARMDASGPQLDAGVARRYLESRDR